MKTWKKTGGVDSRGEGPAADDPLQSESLPEESAPNQPNFPNGVDEMVSSFLLELNSISNPWGSGSDAENLGKVDPSEVAINEQGKNSSPSLHLSGDDFSATESRMTFADLDRRIANLLDHIEREQGKAVSPSLREMIEPEAARSPAPKSAATVTQPIQELPAAAARPGSSGSLALEGDSNREVAQPAAKPEARAAFQSASRVQSRVNQIPAVTWILAPTGLLAAGAVIWVFMGSPRIGQEKMPSVTPTLPAAAVSQALVAEQPEVAPASIPKTTAAKTAPSQPAGSDSRRGIAGIPEARAGAGSGNPGRAITARAPSSPDPKVPAQMTETARGLPPQPSEPNANMIAVRPIQEQSRTALVEESMRSAVANPIRNMPDPASPPSPPPAETTAGNAQSAQPPPAVSTNTAAAQPPEARANPDPMRSTSAAPAIPSVGGTLRDRQQPATPYVLPKPPVAISKIAPEYPPLARRLGISGTVVVSVDVSEEGNVVRAVAVSGPSQLRTAAENALKKWKFAPATQNGVKVESSLSISVAFNQ